MPKKSLSFSVDSQLMGELGEKLVTKNYIALSELIKNSYDADSSSVSITFVNASADVGNNDDSAIIISDNGEGLSFEEIQTNWMRVATSNKLSEPTSRVFGRPRAGNKGIGRFACQRLSRFLEIETTAKIAANKFEKTTVNFDWSKFEPGTDLSTIPCEYKKTIITDSTSGFRMRLLGLKEKWTQRDFNMLRRQVLLLSVNKGARRKGFKEDPGFDIVLTSNDFETGQNVIFEDVLNAGWATLRIKVSAKGEVKLALAAKYLDDKEFVLDKKYTTLARMTSEIGWLVQDPNYIRRREVLPKYLSHELMELGGVRVYNDGFRIFPYGDPNNDWLNIDNDVARRQSSLRNSALIGLAKKLKVDPQRVLLGYPRHRSLLGRVFLPPSESSSFTIKMDREGLVENKSYLDLVEVLRLGIDWMVIYHAIAKRKIARERSEAIQEAFFSSVNMPGDSQVSAFNSALDFLSDSAKSSSKMGAPRVDAAIITKARKVIELKVKETDSELTLLRALASTSPLLFAFAHEVKGIIGSLNTNALFLEDLSQQFEPNVRDEMTDLAASFRKSSQRFNQLFGLFGVFNSAKALSRDRHSLKNIIESVIQGFSFITENFHIQIELDVEERVKSPLMPEAELYSIVVNLISNAVKAVIAEGKERILIRAWRDSRLYIQVFDNGIGLNPKYWKDVFEALTVDPENQLYEKLLMTVGDSELSTLGKGTGIGLSITKGIVEGNNGSIEFVDPGKNWVTCVEVTLP